MIELRNICKTYKDKKKHKETKALKSVNYKFGDTGLYFITGKSGSGKSTLLSILSGIDFDFKGDLLIDGKSIKEFTKNDINYYRSSYLGFIFQDYNLIPELNAYDNVKLGFDVSNNDNEEDIHEIFKKLDIEELEERELNELSGGEKQRVAIARCLVKKPKVILADEPTGALDPVNSRIIMDTLYSLSKEYLVIVVTHNTNYLDEYESNKLYLDHGILTTEDLIEAQVKEEYKSEKYKGLSNKLKFKLGLEVLLHKKISLILSLFFVILSLICVSISISGMNYDPNYSVYKELEAHDDYVVANYDKNNQSYNNNYILNDELNSLTKYNQDFVYGYNARQLFENSDISDYYLNNNNQHLPNASFLAFEYDDKSINLFDLKVINGKAPETDEEILITDITCEYFIDNDYSYDDISKNINTYDDMIGLSLFGFKISGVVSTKNSEFYKETYNNYDYSIKYYTYYNLMVYSGCANAIFTYKKLYDSVPLYIEYGYTDKIIYGIDVTERNDSIKDVHYFDGFNSNSNGIILNVNYASLYLFKDTYSNAIQKNYKSLRMSSMYSSYTDEELEVMAKEKVDAGIMNSNLYLKNISFLFKGNEDYTKSESNYITNVIGVSFDLSASESMYINSEDFDIVEESYKYSNVVAIFSSFSNSNREYKNTLIKNLKYLNTSSIENKPMLFLSNARAQHIFDEHNVFLALEIIFGSLGIVFLLISLFIMYKYINDSISYKEKDIGVLKSIGVSERDIIGIFNIQNLFIMSISLIVSIVVQYVGVWIVNKAMSRIFEMECYVVSYRIIYLNYLAIIFIAIIIPLIATLSPILKIAHKNPKDVLNNN